MLKAFLKAKSYRIIWGAGSRPWGPHIRKIKRFIIFSSITIISGIASISRRWTRTSMGTWGSRARSCLGMGAAKWIISNVNHLRRPHQMNSISLSIMRSTKIQVVGKDRQLAATRSAPAKMMAWSTAASNQWLRTSSHQDQFQAALARITAVVSFSNQDRKDSSKVVNTAPIIKFTMQEETNTDQTIATTWEIQSIAKPIICSTSSTMEALRKRIRPLFKEAT